MDALYICLGVH